MMENVEVENLSKDEKDNDGFSDKTTTRENMSPKKG